MYTSDMQTIPSTMSCLQSDTPTPSSCIQVTCKQYLLQWVVYKVCISCWFSPQNNRLLLYRNVGTFLLHISVIYRLIIYNCCLCCPKMSCDWLIIAVLTLYRYLDIVWLVDYCCFNIISRCCVIGWLMLGPSYPWSYGTWIYNYLCNQCLSPLMLRVRIQLRWGVLDTTLCDKVCQWLAAGQWFSPGTPVSSTNKTDRHDIAEILLKVVL